VAPLNRPGEFGASLRILYGRTRVHQRQGLKHNLVCLLTTETILSGREFQKNKD
jgi:hypothetical protein